TPTRGAVRRRRDRPRPPAPRGGPGGARRPPGAPPPRRDLRGWDALALLPGTPVTQVAVTSEAGTRWQPVEPLPPVNGAVAPILATVDSLRRAWEEALESSTVEERAAARERRLRRHAVGTGINQRLYEA